jgi:hypothetical protein
MKNRNIYITALEYVTPTQYQLVSKPGTWKDSTQAYESIEQCLAKSKHNNVLLSKKDIHVVRITGFTVDERPIIKLETIKV